MTIAIVIPTYQRDDGKTPEYLIRALTSIKNQTYQDYKIFLIGDDYKNNNEFIEIATSIIDIKKILYINLAVAVERERYKSNKNTNLFYNNKILWCCAGANARNVGIYLSLVSGYHYICALDHDDYWQPEHLELINEQCETNQYIIIATRSTFSNNSILPKNQLSGLFFPEACNLVHSSTCIKFSDLTLRYRDCMKELNKIEASDADLWLRLSDHMKMNNLKGYLIDKITCNYNF